MANADRGRNVEEALVHVKALIESWFANLVTSTFGLDFLMQ